MQIEFWSFCKQNNISRRGLWQMIPREGRYIFEKQSNIGIQEAKHGILCSLP